MARDYMIVNDDVYCFSSKESHCFLRELPEAHVLRAFHDAELATATKQINAILDEIHRKNTDPERGLAFLDTSEGLLLAWVRTGAVSSQSAEVNEALGLS